MELLLAAIGALSGIAGLAWAVWMWVLAGPRVVVRVLNEIHFEATFSMGGKRWPGTFSGSPREWRRSHPKDRLLGWILYAEIRNNGRAAVTITDVRLDGTVQFNPHQDNPTLPHRLEPQSQLMLAYEVKPFPLPAQFTSYKAVGYLYVYLGNGKKVFEPIWADRRPLLPLWRWRWFEEYPAPFSPWR